MVIALYQRPGLNVYSKFDWFLPLHA